MAPFGASRAGLMSVVGDDIPDPDVYLQDDWGDGKFQNRDDSGTTTYNGVEGVYRPEWDELAGSVEVIDNDLVITGSDDAVVADINLALDETITWTWDVDFSDNGGAGTDLSQLHLWTQDSANKTTTGFHESYVLRCRTGVSDEDIIFNKTDSSGGSIEIGRGGNLSTKHEIKATRQPNGDLEIFIDGTSIITVNDTGLSNPVEIGFTSRDNSQVIVEEMKVN